MHCERTTGIGFLSYALSLCNTGKHTNNTHIHIYKKNVKIRKWEQSGNRNISLVYLRVQEGEHIRMYSGQNIDFPMSFLLHFRK